GTLACPACGGLLAGWGRARERLVRGVEEVSRVTPRRARGRGCSRAHVLLPGTWLSRRAGEGGGGGGGAGGGGGRGRRPGGARGGGGVGGGGAPAGRVGGGRGAGAGGGERVGSAFTALAAGLVTAPPLPTPAGSPIADAVAAVAAAAMAAAAFLAVGEVARW